MNEEKGFNVKAGDVLTTEINHFDLLYKDAELFLQLAQRAERKEFNQVRFSRTAILLCICSMEALINRVLYTFGQKDFPKFFREEEERWSLGAKWYLAPVLCGSPNSKIFDVDREPWQSFRALIRLRNDYLHPRMRTIAEYIFTSRVIQNQPVIEPVDKTKRYEPTGIPEDFYNILPEHARKVKKIVDAMIDRLDDLLGGKVKTGNWLFSHQFKKKES